MIECIRPALYIGQDALYHGVRQISAESLAPGTRFVVGLEETDGTARTWPALFAGETYRSPQDALKYPSLDSEAPAVLLATSGTTGRSKLVVWTQRMMAAFGHTAESRGMGAADIAAISMPMMHASGVWTIATCLLTRTLGIILGQFDADAVLDAIEKYRCTRYAGLPFMLAELVRRQHSQHRDVFSIVFGLSAGDVCPSDTEKSFSNAFRCSLLSLWAATEDTGAAIPGKEPGPLTRFRDDAHLRLVDAEGSTVPHGESGELLIRSPSTTPGYWLGPGRIDPLPRGWFHTGDQMRREPDGQLRYLGRLKHLIVRGGSNISPVEIEEVLLRQPGVADAAVAGLSDPELGQRVGALLVLTEGTTATAVSSILAGVRAELADYKVPEVVATAATIPRSTLMKIDRPAIATALAAAALAAEGSRS